MKRSNLIGMKSCFDATKNANDYGFFCDDEETKKKKNVCENGELNFLCDDELEMLISHVQFNVTIF